ncbi:MAG: PD-(D/E)XK nuclease family protein, partial [Acidimicrobiia bacterium]
MSRERLLPEIVAISPSALDDWERCPRLYLNRHILRLPASDDGAGASIGNLVHDLLRFLHGEGDCHDPELQLSTLENHGCDGNDVVAAMVRNHAHRCPSPARAVGHELEVVRVSRQGPVWIGTGRLDAVWVHDGILDVRDYKTGARRDGALAEDSRARLQAWLAAPLAPGLQVRVRYEHLGDDDGGDPEFEPDPEDLTAIETDITAIVAAIIDAAGTEQFVGVHESDTCRTCGYRSICPDSAVTGVPTWPLPDDHVPA